MTWSLIVGLVLKLVTPIMSVVTPTLRHELQDWLVEYYKRAEETSNPWDDILAGFLLDVLGIPRPKSN